MELSIVIPAYNEEKRIVSTLKSITNFFSFINQYEIIVIDDGSSDKTEDVVKKLSISNLKIVKQDKNYGKGRAIKTGAENAKGNKILIMDADCSASLESYHKLEKELNDNFPVVIGSRALSDSVITAKFGRKILGRIFALYINLLFNLKIRDTQCGFKLFNGKILKDLVTYQTLDSYSYDVELLYLAKNKNYGIKEVAIHWKHVPNSKVNVLKDGIKVFLECLLIRIKN